MLLIVFVFAVGYAHIYSGNDNYLEYSGRRTDILNLNETFFSSLVQYEVGARPASVEKYPWIARVVHSIGQNIPHACTASCIKERIFITAARCIFNLKIKFTKVVYADTHHLPAKAFVIPSKLTQQLYDDIGFIVVRRTEFVGEWDTIPLDTATQRTDDAFQWVKKLRPSGYMAVGYTMSKEYSKLVDPTRIYTLSELPVYIGMDLCATIMTYNFRFKGYHVPCYHSCSVQQQNNHHEACAAYHGAEGGAIIDRSRDVMIGVAIWGSFYLEYDLPVGFSYVNSQNFYVDYECAKIISEDAAEDVELEGYYQKLCNE